jgi:hypothetical protein
MSKPKPDHFHYNIRPVPMVDPAKPEIATLIFRLNDGQHHFSMPRQAFEQLSQEILVELERVPLRSRRGQQQRQATRQS